MIVRQREIHFLRAQSDGTQDAFELIQPETDDGLGPVLPFHAVVGHIHVRLGKAREILQAQLVLDGDDQNAV
ncbi:hypothetical protein CTI14_42705, partial [Methylobacterium radiotolerans]